jgi:hypothetical protein
MMYTKPTCWHALTRDLAIESLAAVSLWSENLAKSTTGIFDDMLVDLFRLRASYKTLIRSARVECIGDIESAGS